MNETLSRDQNHVTVLGGVTDDSNLAITMLRVDPTTKRLLVSATGLPGGGTVNSVSVVSSNGFAGTVANPTTTPAITLSTTITGLLQGNGTSISAVTIGSGLTFTGGTLSSTAGGGTVTSISIASSNGFTGTSSGGATPILTLATSITGFLLGNGTSVSGVGTNGSGNVVLTTSAILVTPFLGTPQAIVLTNATGTATGLTAGNVVTNANLTGAITSVGNAASLGSFTSSQLATALTDETGTGANVFGVQPTLTSNIQSTVATNAASGTNTFNMATGNVQNFTFSGSSASDSVTFALSNITTNQIFIISVTQNSGGSGTVTWFSTIKWVGGTVPTLTTTASKRDTFGFICTGSGTYDGFIIGQNI